MDWIRRRIRKFCTIMAKRDEEVANSLRGYPSGSLHFEWRQLSLACADLWMAIAAAL